MTAREFATQRLPDHLEADEVAAIIRADELRAIAPGRHILNHHAQALATGRRRTRTCTSGIYRVDLDYIREELLSLFSFGD